jgi:CHASE2 domain-containing sensor protein/signal transduction histidine kinase
MRFHSFGSLWSAYTRRFLYEWLGAGCLGVGLIFLVTFHGLSAGADLHAYDRLLRFVAEPVSPDIVLVEIDDKSVSLLGRWPWPRQLHAQLLERIATARPAAVIYDVLFTEPGEGDDELSRAVALSPTYLPILLSQADTDGRAATVPVESIVRSAAGLGHINLEVDSDGVLRSIAMFEDDAVTRWPQITIPVIRAIREGKISVRDMSHLRVRSSGTTSLSLNGSDRRFLIPFSSRIDTYQKVSFSDVLEGRISPEELQGKIVLVGVTASGLYGRFSTPVSSEFGPLPGLYIQASTLDALLSGRAIAPASASQVFSASLVLLIALLVGLLLLSPLRSLLLTILLCVVATITSFALLSQARLWMTPVPAIIALQAVYAIWNWRQLEMTLAYLRKELRGLANEPYALSEVPQPVKEFHGDVLQQHMALMAQASARVQAMKRFVWNSLDSVPGPVLVSDTRGVVVIANNAAKGHFARLGISSPVGRLMLDALGGLEFTKSVESGSDMDSWVRARWPEALDPASHEFSVVMERGVEVRDSMAHDYLLRYARCTDEQNETTGWIAGMVDVTDLHVAERHREDALNLLSHEMRSPQASILALIQIERARLSDSGRIREFLSQIERYANGTLSLADDFVHLARAEWHSYSLELVNLSEIALDASDEVWPQARAKHIHIDVRHRGEAGCWISADRSLMTRAIVNLLNNAIKYSPERTVITCTVEDRTSEGERAPSLVQCTVEDQGYGIPADKQALLFERFRRFHELERPDIGGAGIGLSFVKTVVVRHGGEIFVSSSHGKGTVITIVLPALLETAGNSKTT